MADEKYRLTLEGSEIDEALLRLANYEDEGLVLGSRKGVMLGPGSEYYHKNARYYAELAQSAVPGDTTSAVRWDIDQSALTDADREMARKNIRAGGNNRNFFDNSWFTINQRGLTSYSAGYSVDRWVVTSNASINVLSNGIELTTTANRWGLEQRCVKNLIPHGTTVTFSALIDDGEIVQGSFVWNGANVNLYPDGADVGLEINTSPTAYDRWYVCNKVASTHIIHAVKLETGSFSTLLNDVPPDYGEELAKCQRYFQRVVAPSYGNGFGFGRAHSATACRVYIPLPVPLRASPTVSITNIGSVSLAGNGNTYACSAMEYSGRSESGVNLSFTTSGLTANQLYMLYRAGSADTYIDLSADFF